MPQQMRQVTSTMKSLPTNMKMQPRVVTAPKRRMFEIISPKAVQALLQKLRPYTATMMYAFFEMNFTHLSRHHKRYEVTHRMAFTILELSAACLRAVFL